MARRNGKNGTYNGHKIAPLDTIYLCIDYQGNVRPSRPLLNECGGTIDDELEDKSCIMAIELEAALKEDGYEKLAANAMSFQRYFEKELRKNRGIDRHSSGPKSLMPDIMVTRKSGDRPKKRDY